MKRFVKKPFINLTKRAKKWLKRGLNSSIIITITNLLSTTIKRCSLILDAITRAGSDDPEAITKALAETKDLATPLGALSINATHDAELPVGIIQYKDGKRAYIGEAIAE